MRDNVMKVRD